MNTDQSDKILSKEECELERTSQQLSEWVEKKNKLFCKLSKQGEGIKRKVILREGLFKEFYEEIYPLSLFAQHYYKGRTDVVFKPKIGSRNFDALILDRSKKPIHKIEITQAHGGHDEHLRMLYFLGRRHVPVLGKVTHRGTKNTGQVIDVESEAIDHSEVVKKGQMLIAEALGKKSKKGKKHYSIDTLLLLVFDDYIAFWSDEDKAILNEFVRKKTLSLKLDFDKLFLIGWSGNSFYEFPIVSEDMNRPHI